MSDQVYVRPAGTSWGSVLGGWVATVGMAALLAPIIAAIVVGAPTSGENIAAAVPFVVGVMLAYLVGGYVAGRMAGYNTSWHGLLTAFFGLFIVLIALLLVAAADQGILAGAGIRSLADVSPGLLGLNVQTLGDAFTFGAIIGFLAAIFAGWLGGLLAPSHAAVVARPAAPVVHEPVAERRVEERVERPATGRRFRFLPTAARKGGERVERHEHLEPGGDREVHEHPVERS
ncbi:MAG: hypothetical protein ACRDGE_02445 [Candidatus Limnocylindria bacterium]